MGAGIETSRLLAGVRVLDLSIWRPGPYATQLLVELGADVVKVEPPGGDPMRVFPRCSTPSMPESGARPWI